MIIISISCLEYRNNYRNSENNANLNKNVRYLIKIFFLRFRTNDGRTIEKETEKGK